MGLILTDEELMQVSTSDLRTLFETKEISAEEHRQLRSRRRRLQNRKYARKCARKKQTEVERLTSEVEEEKLQIQLLRRQLSRVKLSTQRMQHQIVRIASFHQDCLQASITCARDGHSRSHPSRIPSDKPTLRMVSQDGRQAGLATFTCAGTTNTGITATSTSTNNNTTSKSTIATTSINSNTNSSSRAPPAFAKCPPENPPFCRLATAMVAAPQLRPNPSCRLRQPYHMSPTPPAGSSFMPAQLAAGPGLPSGQSLQSHFSPMRLVRPVGCGWASSAGLSEF